MALSQGTKLGRYEIRSSLGAGGMGEVYLARDERINRDVAIKVLPPTAADPERLRRFEQEAQATGALNHSNLLAVYDVKFHWCTSFPLATSVFGKMFTSPSPRNRMRPT